MVRTRVLGMVAAAQSLCVGVALAGTIEGSVSYSGAVPNLKPVSMDADPTCAAKHSSPVPNDILVLGDANALGNVAVSVESGLPAGKTYPAPAGAAEIDQDGCMYSPHVLGIQTGQALKFKNTDAILHNVHALPQLNKEFNLAMPGNVKEKEASFPKEEGFFKVKCDVHPWMNAYVRVYAHPYFSITAKDGKFKIENVPAGTYELSAWHEKLGTQKQSVTIAEGETKNLTFTFSAPGK